MIKDCSLYTHTSSFQLALSHLQTKAEMEISKAHQLISEKDAELQAAEESLSGLVEVLYSSTSNVNFAVTEICNLK